MSVSNDLSLVLISVFKPYLQIHLMPTSVLSPPTLSSTFLRVPCGCNYHSVSFLWSLPPVSPLLYFLFVSDFVVSPVLDLPPRVAVFTRYDVRLLPAR